MRSRSKVLSGNYEVTFTADFLKEFRVSIFHTVLCQLNRVMSIQIPCRYYQVGIDIILEFPDFALQILEALRSRYLSRYCRRGRNRRIG